MKTGWHKFKDEDPDHYNNKGYFYFFERTNESHRNNAIILYTSNPRNPLMFDKITKVTNQYFKIVDKYISESFNKGLIEIFFSENDPYFREILVNEFLEGDIREFLDGCKGWIE